MNRIPLATHLPLPDIIRDEIEVLVLLKEFMTLFVNGPNLTVTPTFGKGIKLDSICNDVMYVVSNGRKVPANYLELGLAMKSLTGSRKVVEVLNKLDHCISYSFVKSLKTKLAYSVVISCQTTPNGLNVMLNLRTGATLIFT